MAYWERAYNAITKANTILSNIERVEDWNSEEERNQHLAAAYFHQAYWYYRLVHQFGDVPVHLAQIEEPKIDFNTYNREAILKQMRDHMEFAVNWLPRNVQRGGVNRAAGHHLLTKIYLSLQQFEDAIDASSQVIDNSKYTLMQDRFGSGRFADDPDFNVMWDLHEKENISLGSNTESILVTQDQFNVEGSPGPTNRNRNLVPIYFFINGVTVAPNVSFTDSVGRGVAFIAPSPYFSYKIWDDPDDDYRHDDTNWFSKDDFYFNDKEWLEDNGYEDLYKKPLTKERVQEVGWQADFDTTRNWFPFPYNKFHVPDETMESRINGGHSDAYVFRLAGTYLLRAEAYHWNDQPDRAADDVNAVRKRSNADPVTAGEVDIDYIFDERARELYWEEPRKTEMTRVSYIMARSNVQEGAQFPEDMAQENWWHDRTDRLNKHFRENMEARGFAGHTFNVVPKAVYWPVPQSEIDANTGGTINQWRGYQGSENNIEPKGYDEIQQLPGANEHNNLEGL